MAIFNVRSKGVDYEVFTGVARTITKIVRQNKNGTNKEIYNAFVANVPSAVAKRIIEIAKREYELD
jgi:hypothetical protein